MDGKSKDLIVDNIEKIKSLFPEAVNEIADKEGKVSFRIDMEKLSILLGDAAIPTDEVEYRQKYGEKFTFEWSGKRLAIAEAQKRSAGTLRPCPEESVDWDNTENLYIEGDNLEVLKLLQDSYMGAIKMIYIDPPYNTGKDFVYKDNYKDNLSNYLEQTNTTNAINSETSGRYHTNWLNMMYPRLKLARNLLTDDGVIFISIDDHEVANLRRICDEVFDEDNFVALLSIENNPKGRKNSKFISVSNDYCLIYTKNNINSFFVENVPKNIKDLSVDENGNFVHNSGKRVLVGENEFNKNVENFNSEKHYVVYYNENTNEMKCRNEININDADNDLGNKGFVRYYSSFNEHFVENTYTQNKLYELFNEGALEFKNNKIYEKNMSTKIRLKSLLVNKSYSAVVDGKEEEFEMDFKTTSAGTYLKELFNAKVSFFSAPKNICLIKILATLFDDKNHIVLDFFSGSGTTADAICRLNRKDEGKRKYILVQLPETIDPEKASSLPAKQSALAAVEYLIKNGKTVNLCELAKERIRRAGKKIVEEQKVKGDNLFSEEKKPDVGFKVFKLDRSNVKNWDIELDSPNEQDAATQLKVEFNKVLDILKPDRSELDMLYEVMLKLGILLTTKVEEKKVESKKVFVVGSGVMVATFAKGLTYKQIGQMLDMKADFISSGEFKFVVADESFANSNDKTNALQLFKQRGITNYEII